MKNLSLALGAIALSLAAQQAVAKVGADEAAKLGTTLTPVGAEKAGNKDGSIPEWAPAAQKGSLKGEFPIDEKIMAEKPKFTITKASLDQYKDKLTEGHKYLLKTYDTYKMNVYPTHRQTSWPQPIYDATKANATTCELIGTDLLDNCKLGFPFPIPKSGAEVLWNSKLKFRGTAVRRFNDQAIVKPDGNFKLTKLVEDLDLKARVDLRFGFHPRADIARWANDALACAYLPFDEDSVGYVTMEAFASGKAVLTVTDRRARCRTSNRSLERV